MTKVKRSEYIIVTRIICRTLFKTGCFGKGSLYLDNLTKGLNDREFSRLKINKDKIKIIIESLVKQKIILKKKRLHGWKYYLNIDRLDKIKEIIKETGYKSFIPVLLMLLNN
ncbi:MAG: hypothetical protein ABII01_03330 [Candidatus Woesearchaeota archaeon]